MRRLLYRKQVTKIKLSVAKSVVLALGLLIAFYPGYSKSAQVAPSNKPIELEVITLLGDQAKALPEFELIDHNKQILTNTRLSGKWNLMFFGYTSCPDICPTTLNDMNHVVNAIKDPEVLDALKVYFVSVDPQRDTTELLASYLSFFNPEFTGATANTEKLEVLTSALGVSYKITEKNRKTTSTIPSPTAVLWC